MSTFSIKNPKDKNLEGSELLIIEAAQKAFLEFGFQGTTIKMIADLATISHSAVHYYFRSKEILFEIVYCRCMTILLDSIVDFDFLNKETGLVQRKVNHPELLSIAWFVANEFRSNSRLVIEIMRRNDELRAKMNTVYKTPEFLDNFQFLINQAFMKSSHLLF